MSMKKNLSKLERVPLLSKPYHPHDPLLLR
jgi:hypothetical protein